MLLHFTIVREGSSLCQTRRTTEGKGWSFPYATGVNRPRARILYARHGWQRLEPSLTLPQPLDEILKLPLVVLYGRNRRIHKTFHHPQIRGLRNVGLALHRIQG